MGRAAQVARAQERVDRLLAALVLHQELAVPQPRLLRLRILAQAGVELGRAPEDLPALALHELRGAGELAFRAGHVGCAPPVVGPDEVSQRPARPTGLQPVLAGRTVVAPAGRSRRRAPRDSPSGARTPREHRARAPRPDDVPDGHDCGRVRHREERRHRTLDLCEAEQRQQPPEVEPRQQDCRHESRESSAHPSQEQAHGWQDDVPWCEQHQVILARAERPARGM